MAKEPTNTDPSRGRLGELEKMSSWTNSGSQEPGGEEAIVPLVLRAVRDKRPVIISGPPGTGKTRLAEKAKEAIAGEGLLGRSETVQFHRQYSYEDFIEGIKPIPETGTFDIVQGSFRHFCGTVQAEASNRKNDLIDIFLIDEINRADIASTLGEVLYLLEDRATRRTTTAHSHTEFVIPQSIALVGTMNSADRSTAILDFALRRRFTFFNLYPDYRSMLTWLQSLDWAIENISREEYVAFARSLNQRILSEPLLGKNMQLGQALFVPSGATGRKIALEDLTDQLNTVVLPQVEAYAGLGNPDVLRTLIAHEEVYESVLEGAWISPDLAQQFTKAHSSAAGDAD